MMLIFYDLLATNPDSPFLLTHLGQDKSSNP